ncbi:MAG: pyridoxal phosphate-dependent aminotransferase [Pseudomonadota bacterium]
MQVSQRLQNINGGGDDGWALFERSRAMIAAGIPVIELTQGEHDIPTDPMILAAMDEAAQAGHTGYAPIMGIPALRDVVAARITERTGVLTTRDNIIIEPGGQAGLYATHHAVLDVGETALYIDPHYATYPGTIRGVGGVPVAVAARPDAGFLPDPADISAVAAGAKSLLINSPNNPTGVVYDQSTLEGIAQVCSDHDLWLISDEVYDTQVWNGTHISPRSLPNMGKRTLVIGSMSKSHAMTGSRVGWVCGPEEMIAHLGDLATNTTYGVPGYIQQAALFGLNAGSDLEERVAAPFRRRRALSIAVLEGQNILRPVPADGAMYMMLDVRGTGLSGEAFGEALLDAEHIAVMPGESFGHAAAGHIRIAMTAEDTAYEDALRRIVSFAQSRV